MNETVWVLVQLFFVGDEKDYTGHTENWQAERTSYGSRISVTINKDATDIFRLKSFLSS